MEGGRGRGSERAVWDDADQGLGVEPIYVTGRRQDDGEGQDDERARAAGSKDPSRLVT